MALPARPTLAAAVALAVGCVVPPVSAAAAPPLVVPAVVPAAVVAPAATAATAGSLTLDAPASTLARTRTTLAVTWKPATTKTATGTLTLQRLREGRWSSVRTVKLVGGTGRVVVKPASTTTYRVVGHGLRSTAVRLPVLATGIRATVSRPSVVKGTAFTVSARMVKKARPLARGTLRLQERRGGAWVTVKKVRIVSGEGSARVRPTTTRTYRLVSTTVTSPKVKVTVTKTTSPPVTPPDPLPDPATVPTTAPATFTAKGSGYGHGVGMSQYGAYQLARNGSSASSILTHYYTGTALSARAMPSSIAVQVFGPEPYSFVGYADTATSTTFSLSTGSWQLRQGSTTLYPRPGASPADPATSAVQVRLSVSGTSVRATIVGGSAAGTSFTAPMLRLRWSGTEYYLPSGTAAVATLTGAGGTYRHGRLTATVIGGRLNVVNELSMTEYLYGIAEMPSSWGLGGGAAALQAQAIAARTYAYVRAGATAAKPDGTRKSACNCHLVDDVRDQMYTGWKKEGEAVGSTSYGAVWRAAVDATTASTVVTYAGSPISTYYFSSSGGATANSEDVWVSEVPYLRAVPDPESLSAPGNTMASWTRTITQARLAGIFHLSGIGRVEVVARYASGQVKTLRATSTSGATTDLTLKSAVWSSTLGGLPSSWISSIS